MAAGGNPLGYKKDSSANSWTRYGNSGQEDEFGETPQRPPTVGQELPNNLYQARPKSRRVAVKKGISEKNSTGQIKGTDRPLKGNPEHRPPYPQMSTRTHQKDGTRKPERSHHNDTEESNAEMETRCRNDQANVQNRRDDAPRYRQLSESGQAQNNASGERARCAPSSSASVDVNTVMARLLEIQEYIRRVSTSIESLEKTRDKRAMESLPKLYSVRADLVENEQHLLRLLEKLSTRQNKYPPLESSDRNVEADSNGLLDDDATDQQVQKEVPGSAANSEELADALAKRNELLQKVAMSHEKLQALQDQQTVLLALKEKAAKDALSARATVEDLKRKTAAIMDFQRDKTSPSDEPQASTAVSNDMSPSISLQKDLDDLKSRLKTLHNICESNKDVKQLPGRNSNNARQSQHEPYSGDENCDDGIQNLDIINSQRRNPENGTHELEMKKRQVDDLIQELHNLRQVELRRSGLLDNSDLTQKESVAANAQKMMADTRKDLQAMDATNKLMQLTEMQKRLHALQEMVDTLEPVEEATGQMEVKVPSNSYNNPTVRAASILNTRNSPASLNSSDNMPKADNLRRVCVQDRVLSEAAEVGQRFKKLKSTKDKLQKLQEVLAMVQQSDPQDRKEAVECAEQLLASLDEYPGDDGSECSESDPRNRRPYLGREEVPDSRDIRHLQDHQSEADLVNFLWNAKVSGGRQAPAARVCQSPRLTKDTLNRDHDNIGRPSRVPSSQPRHWAPRTDDGFHGGRNRSEWNGVGQTSGVTAGGGTPSAASTLRCNSYEAWHGLSKADASLLAVVEGTSAATWGSSSQDLEERGDSQDDDGVENEAYSSEEPAEGAEEDEDDDEEADENVRYTATRTAESMRNCSVCGSCIEAECPLPERCRENNSARQLPSLQKRKQGVTWPNAATTTTRAAPASKVISHRVLPNNVANTPPSSAPSAEQDSSAADDRPFVFHPQSRTHLQQQMETTSQLCQSLMQDNTLMNSILQQHVPVALGNSVSANVNAVGACSPAPTPATEEIVEHRQQVSQRTQRVGAVVGNSCPPALQDFCIEQDAETGPWPLAQHLQQNPVTQQNASLQQQPQLFTRHIQTQPLPTTTNGRETLNNQVPPGTRANNYWDNFRSYSRQNLFSAASCNKSNEFAGPSTCPNNQRGPAAASAYSVHHGLPTSSPSQMLPTHSHITVPFTCKLTDGWAPESQHLLMTATSLTSGLTVSTADSFAGAQGAEAAGGQQENPTANYPPADHHVQPRERAKDKAVNEHAGAYSNVFPRPDGASARVPDHRSTASKLHAKSSWPKQGKDASKRLRASADSDLNREAIDAAVSALIAQNESEPQLLISLLRGLSLLDSRQLRDRALMALRDVACREDVTPVQSTTHKTALDKKEMVNLEEPDFPKNSGEEEFLRHLSWDDRIDYDSKGCEGNTFFGIFQDDGNVVRGTSREISDSSQNRPVDVRRLEAQIDSVLQDIAPMLRGRPTDLCTPKLLSRISQRIIDCLTPQIEHHQSSLGEPHSRDSRYFYKQLTTLLDEVVMKYTGRRLVECADVLLMELSEVFSKELAFMFVFPNPEVQSCRPRVRNQRHGQEPSIPEFASLLPPTSVEITDADLVLMAKRDEHDERDRGYMSPSCDIPDVARRETLDIVEGVAACAPRINSSDHLCGDECGKFLEAEAEGEEVGDNRDLAEADQSHDYLDDDEDHQGHVDLDDGEEGQGDQERTEDDLGERSEPAGAAAINAAAANQVIIPLVQLENGADAVDAMAMAAEMVLDEVPTKLRDPGHRSGSEGGEVSPDAKRSDSDGAVSGGPGPGTAGGSSAGQSLGSKSYPGE